MNGPSFFSSCRWAVWFLLAVTLVAYGGVGRLDFVNLDDDVYIYNNPHIQDGLTWHGIKWALEADLIFPSENADYWQPVTFLSRMLDIQLFGLNPTGHHLMNLLFHLLNTLLLFHILRRMTGHVGRSAMVAALFAVHPLHVESVAWVTERKDVLSGFFWMLTLWAYGNYTSEKHGSAPSSAHRTSNVERRTFSAWYSLTLLFFALGLMAKPMVITLPFVLLLLDHWPLRRIQMHRASSIERRVFLEKLPMLAMSFFSGLITLRSQGQCLQTSSPEVGMENSLIGYALYLVKTIWPHPLAIHYPRPPGLPSLDILWGSILLLSLISFLAIRGRKRFPFLGVGWFWYVGTLAPVVHLQDILVADRFTYLPLIGIFIVGVWGISSLLEPWKGACWFLPVLSGTILACCMLASIHQLKFWQNSMALFEHATQTVGEDALAHRNLALALVQKGKIDEAIGHYRQAIQWDPGAPENYNDLGNAFLRMNKKGEAASEYLTALRLNPDYSSAHFNLGIILVLEGRMEEAARHFRRAAQISPDFVLAHYNLGLCLGFQGKRGEALLHLQKALDLQPNFQPAREALTIIQNHK